MSNMPDHELVNDLPAARQHYREMSEHLLDAKNRDDWKYYMRLLHARDLLCVAKMKAGADCG